MRPLIGYVSLGSQPNPTFWEYQTSRCFYIRYLNPWGPPLNKSNPHKMDITQLSGFIHGKRITFEESNSNTKEYAAYLDSQDKLAHFKTEFLIPSKADLKDPHPEAKSTDQLNGSFSSHSISSISTVGSLILYRPWGPMYLPLWQFTRSPTKTHSPTH